jgi:NhaP-type Na+/H+ or K+/H+ antiporter
MQPKLSPSEDKLFKKFQRLAEINYKEHYLTLGAFVIRMFISLIAGVVLGALIERFTKHFQGTRTSRFQCAFFLMLQLFAIVILFYVALRINRTEDDWYTSTIAGTLFGLTFITVQTSLGSNSACFIG